MTTVVAIVCDKSRMLERLLPKRHDVSAIDPFVLQETIPLVSHLIHKQPKSQSVGIKKIVNHTSRSLKKE